jgi:ABC-type transporter Mla maintaining outer membrane lipid asymmetry permease subunit MlaE
MSQPPILFLSFIISQASGAQANARQNELSKEFCAGCYWGFGTRQAGNTVTGLNMAGHGASEKLARLSGW